MGQNPQAVQEWKRLFKQWHEADQLAKQARDEIRDMTLRMANGQVGPTDEQIWAADSLERHAALLRMEMDGFVLGFMS